jgi:hypothetical protein
MRYRNINHTDCVISELHFTEVQKMSLESEIDDFVHELTALASSKALD